MVEIRTRFLAATLTLLHITENFFSPVITNDDTVLLEVFLMRYFKEFFLAFSEVQGINKIIRAQGPPIRYWCMTYEVYHNIAKRPAQVNFNFRNATISVANHLQLLKCGILMF